MERMEAVRAAILLWNKWVTSGSNFDLDRIHESMLREKWFHRTGKSNASAGLIAETKGELILLGKIRKALA